MASKSSKTIPFIVLILTFCIIGIEGYTGVEYDLESYIPLLMTMGFGGGAISIAKKIAETKKQIPDELRQTISDEVKKLKPN